jgi:hypothetical protein
MATTSTSAAEITVPAILIKIAKEWRPGLTPDQLYERTRRYWICSPARKKTPPQFAFSIAKGLIVQVFKISDWEDYDMSKVVIDPTRLFRTRPPLDQKGRIRKGFIGVVSSHPLSVAQIGKSIRHLRFGSGSPFAYVNCD